MTNTTDNDDVVYYEDVHEPSSSQTSTKSTESTASVKTSTPTGSQQTPVKTTATKRKAEPTTETKRQTTIESMFGPKTKKAKVTAKVTTASTSASGDVAESATDETEKTTATDGAPKRKQGTTLNSIPFSMSEYEDSLSAQEKELLQLECATLGKSW
jgi:uracil-DNA glycosylase